MLTHRPRVPFGTLMVLSLAAACALPATPPSSSVPVVPDRFVGSFVDDYGTTYLVTDSTWTHGSETLRIAAWSTTDRHLLATGLDDDGVLAWVRIDWMELDPDMSVPSPQRWTWAWCMAFWDAPTREAALEAPESRRETPRTGCGDGFPFTRMQRTPDVPSR